MTGIYNNNYEEFHKNTKFLRGLGWTVISPAEMDEKLGVDPTQPFSEEQYLNTLRHDYKALADCDAIAFMPGWEKSRGAKLESDFANVLKLDRYRVDASSSYFEKELVIALTGFARSGKDSIAQEFVKNDRFERIGFADSLKEMLYQLNPQMPYLNYIDLDNDGIVHVKDYINYYGWEDAKSFPCIRESLQILGSEAGRDVLGENIWIDTLFKKPTAARVIIPDCRYPNEAEAVRDRGGIVVRVYREGVVSVNSHASDQINFDADIEIHNNGTVNEAYIEIMEQLPKFGIHLKPQLLLV